MHGHIFDIYTVHDYFRHVLIVFKSGEININNCILQTLSFTIIFSILTQWISFHSVLYVLFIDNYEPVLEMHKGLTVPFLKLNAVVRPKTKENLAR